LFLTQQAKITFVLLVLLLTTNLWLGTCLELVAALPVVSPGWQLGCEAGANKAAVPALMQISLLR